MSVGSKLTGEARSIIGYHVTQGRSERRFACPADRLVKISGGYQKSGLGLVLVEDYLGRTLWDHVPI